MGINGCSDTLDIPRVCGVLGETVGGVERILVVAAVCRWS